MDTLISPENHATLWAMMAAGTAAAFWLEQRFRWGARLSAPVLALAIAMLLSNTRVAPSASGAYDVVGDWLVPLAVPLLLFRANLRDIFKLGGRVFLVFHLSAVGTLLGTAAAVALFRSAMPSPDLEHASGMMAASYMGGSVNFVALKESYSASADVADPLIVADNFVMAAVFVALLGIAASSWFRKRYAHPHSAASEAEPETGGGGEAANLAAQHWSRKEISLLDLALGLAFAFAALAAADLLGSLISAAIGDVSDRSLPARMAAVLATNRFVLLTSVSLLMATVFARPMAKINGPEEIGAYLLGLFLFTIGLPADLVTVLTKAPVYFLFCAVIAGVNVLFTLGAGRLLKLGLEELVVAINANLGGAPTAAAMAISAGWPRLVVPGLLAGIWGYVVGTPAGILVVELLSGR